MWMAVPPAPWMQRPCLRLLAARAHRARHRGLRPLAYQWCPSLPPLPPFIVPMAAIGTCLLERQLPEVGRAEWTNLHGIQVVSLAPIWIDDEVTGDVRSGRQVVLALLHVFEREISLTVHG